VILAGMLNEHQQLLIEYLKAENQVLREQLGPKRIRLNNAGQRCERVRMPKPLHGKVLCSKSLFPLQLRTTVWQNPPLSA